jgi:hypothetical protein
MNCTKTTHTCTTYFDQFEEPGLYEAFYFVRDTETNDISPVKRSIIYKQKSDNQPPKTFELEKPEHGTEHQTTLMFKWNSSTDADGPVTYNFIIAKDNNFSEIVYQQEELETALTYVDDTVGLEDPATYYWKVEAVDPFGERTTSSSVFSFKTNNTNAPPGIGSLHISSALDFTAIESASLEFLDDNGAPLSDFDFDLYQDQGNYNMLLPSGRRRVRISVTGFKDHDIDLNTESGTAQLNVELIPTGGIPTQPGQLQFTATTASVNENAGTVTVLVERAEGRDKTISVDYATISGTATSSDYTSISGTLNWSDQDERAKAIYLPILDDQDSEGAETLTITLSNPTGGQDGYLAKLGNPTQITVTIVDDEVAPEPVPGILQFSSGSYSAEEGENTLNITVSRLDGSDGSVSVQYLVNGTALFGQDYTGGTGTLTWSDGDNADKLLNLNILDDDEVEETETLQLTLFSSTGDATLGRSTASLSITDNDVATPAGTLQFKTASQTVKEGEEITLIVTRLDGSKGEVSVQYMTTGESTAIGNDYTGGSGTLTWADADEADKSLTIKVIDDENVEETETIQLALFNPTSEATLGSPAQATVKISDNDESETPKAEALDSEIPKAEALDSETSALDSEIPKAEALDSEIPKAEALDSSTHAEVLDSEIPKAEALDSENTKAEALDSSTTHVEASVHNSGILQFVSTSYIAEELEGQLHNITVTRAGGNHGEVSVQYLVTTASTASFGVDYTGGNGMLSWADGETGPKAVNLLLIEDDETEPLETVNLILSNPLGQATLGPQAQTTLIITDTVPETLEPVIEETSLGELSTLQFVAPYYTANEGIGDLRTFTVTRHGNSEGEVVVQYQTLAEGSALRDFDYVGGSGQLNWADGDNTPKSIALMILDDQESEDLETIPLILFEPSDNATLGSISRATLVIADNDGGETQPLANAESATSESVENETLVQPQPENEINSDSRNDTAAIERQPYLGGDDNLILPSLGRGTAVANDGSVITATTLAESFKVAAVFRGGASSNGQDYYTNFTLSAEPTQMVNIVGEIEIDEAHQG